MTSPRGQEHATAQRTPYSKNTDGRARAARKNDLENGPRTDRHGRLPAPPPARFQCSREDCPHGRLQRPEDMLWCDEQDAAVDDNSNVKRPGTTSGWYCVRCASDLEFEPTAPRLDEVLLAEGLTALEGGKRTDPACTECAFYGRNVKTSTDAASRELLEETHGIADADCCHPTSLIVRGSGVYDSAAGMRRGWCGTRGILFTEWPRRQRKQTIRGRVLSVGRITPIGAMQMVRIALDGAGRREIERPVGTTTVRKAGLAPGRTCTATLSHRPDGQPELGEWTTGPPLRRAGPARAGEAPPGSGRRP